MAVQIIIDSTADIRRDRMEELGLDIIPMHVSFGEEILTDGVDLDNSEFYSRLRTAEELPKTSQISPATFYELFKKYTDNGDEVFGLFLASKLSGTYQNSVIAAEMIQGEVYTCDSETATFPIAMLVEIAVEMRDSGKSAKEIYDEIEKLKKRMHLMATIDDLKYLYMGGRLSATKAKIATTLNIKPFATLFDGEISVLKSIMGKKKAVKALVQHAAHEVKIDERYGIRVGHADAPEQLEQFVAMLAEEGITPKPSLAEGVGPTIGTHTGPGLVGYCYIEKE